MRRELWGEGHADPPFGDYIQIKPMRAAGQTGSADVFEIERVVFSSEVDGAVRYTGYASRSVARQLSTPCKGAVKRGISVFGS